MWRERASIAVGVLMPTTSRAAAAAAAKIEDAVRLTVSVSVDDLWARLMGSALTEYVRLYRQGLSIEEISTAMSGFLDDLSVAAETEQAARVSSVAYSEGRAGEIEIAAASGQVQFAVRSEVLDSRTCRECELLDGIVVEVGTPEYDKLKPPSHCLGRDRCRGFYVALPRGFTS